MSSFICVCVCIRYMQVYLIHACIHALKLLKRTCLQLLSDEIKLNF